MYAVGKVQKTAFVVVWGCISTHCMDHLRVCEGTIDAEMDIVILEILTLPSSQQQDKLHTCSTLFQLLEASNFKICLYL